MNESNGFYLNMLTEVFWYLYWDIDNIIESYIIKLYLNSSFYTF